MINPSSSEDESDPILPPKSTAHILARAKSIRQPPAWTKEIEKPTRKARTSADTQFQIYRNRSLSTTRTALYDELDNIRTSKAAPQVATPLASRAERKKSEPKQAEAKLSPSETQSQSSSVSDDEERKKKLLLYVLVCRCIAYPFNAKQQSDFARRPLKVTLAQLEQVIGRFASFLKGETQIMADEAFQNAVQSYNDVFLCSDRLKNFVMSGGCCQNDFREVFRKNIEKRVRSLPEIDGLSKETVLTSWMAKFDCIFKIADEEPTRKTARAQPSVNNELILTKEQLYDVFQQVLGVKKFEQQLLHNALQLDNSDEQAAAIRRELDSRLQTIKEKTLPLPKFILKEMDGIYLEEEHAIVMSLMSNLDAQPVTKAAPDVKYGLQKLKKQNPRSTLVSLSSKLDSESVDSDLHLTKADVILTFMVEVVILEVKGLKSLPANRIVYCVMEIDGGPKLQTDQAEASKPMWDTQADFTTTHPLPVLKIKLYTENAGMLALDDKKLADLVLKPTPLTSKNAEWYDMNVAKGFPDTDLKIKIISRMEKPLNMKHCGHLFAMGRSVWKKWKRRYFLLVQVSHYTFALCSYKEKRAEPTEMMRLDGYVVDYMDAHNAHLMFGTDLEGGKYFINAVKDGDSVLLASADEVECHSWIMALYRATGQPNKPTPPATTALKSGNLAKAQADSDRVRRHGMEEFVNADPTKCDHATMYMTLMNAIVEYRFADPYCSMGWLSPGQSFVLEEYATRYGVRKVFHHLHYLHELLNRAENGTMVDPHALHLSYSFANSHVHGEESSIISGKYNTITVAERDKYQKIHERLVHLLEKHVTNFRSTYPFGRPEGALRGTITLFERVICKDVKATDIHDPRNPELCAVLKRCLEKAALLNYTVLTENIQLGFSGEEISQSEKLENLIHLAELCVDQLQQNEEHYSEAFAWFSELLTEHAEIFWSLFAVDMDRILNQQPPDSWESFPLFQILNEYLLNDQNLAKGRFHQHLRDSFSPLVIRYVELMESSISQSVVKNLEKEKWEPHAQGCLTSHDLFNKLSRLQKFIHDLNWPEEDFRNSLEKRLKLTASQMIEGCVMKIDNELKYYLRKGVAFISTEYVVPLEVCVMVNVVHDAKNQAVLLCSVRGVDTYNYLTKVDETIESALTTMTQAIVEKLTQVLESTMTKLNRFDEGNLIGSILSLANATSSGRELGVAYVNFVRNTCDQIRGKVNDELWILNFLQVWYNVQVNMLWSWLSERTGMHLHFHQCACLLHVVRKLFSDFELQGVTEDKLNSKTYQSVLQRMQIEESYCYSAGMKNLDAELPKDASQGNIADRVTDAKNKVGNLVGRIGSISKINTNNWF